jgi:hypothetical protein
VHEGPEPWSPLPHFKLFLASCNIKVVLLDGGQAGRRYLVIVLAVCVFVLALGAKLSLYDLPQPGKISPAAVSKLWVGSDKARPELSPKLPVFWLTASASLFTLAPTRHIVSSLPNRVPSLLHLEQFQPYRFLRPPPSF